VGRVTGAIRGADLHFEGREFEGSCEISSFPLFEIEFVSPASG